MAKQLVGVLAASQQMGVHSNTVREEIRKGELPSIRIGRRVLIDQADIDALIERKRSVPAAA